EKQEVKVTNNRRESRFETTIGKSVCVAAYELEPGVITFTHTSVPPELSGRGIAKELARAGLDHARSEKLKVVPACSFIAKYIERNPEYQDLVSP
ncbi:MAG: GNAT family N-acetyltransferase, partial [Thermoanaerobaculia bacterium]